MSNEIATRAAAARAIATTIANTGVSDPALIGIAGRVLDDLSDIGIRIVRAEPLDLVHQVEFTDAGWTVLHTLDERLDESLFDCEFSRWTRGDIGVRGRFVLDEPNTLGVRIADSPNPQDTRGGDR